MPEKKVLAIVPHPDDAEFYAGGLLAKLVSEGETVKILIATDGRCGTYRNSPKEIIDIRKSEAFEAAKIFNAEVEMLGYQDFELNNVPTLELREKLVRTIRLYRPNIVIAQDAYARNEVHPDHRTLAWAASDAINFSQLPNIFSEHRSQRLEPHFITEKYYYSEDSSRWNKIIDISTFVDMKLKAMKAHSSQVEFLVEDVFKQAAIAGVDLQERIGSQVSDPFIALQQAILATAEEAGKLIHVRYAEGFHYSRFHPYIEELIKK